MASRKTDKVLAPAGLSRKEELLAFEQIKWSEGFSFVAGIDEAGRGCMAGPVVAAAVIFTDPDKIPDGIHDSKQMSEDARMAVREKLLAEPSVLWAVGVQCQPEPCHCDFTLFGRFCHTLEHISE